MKQSDPTIRPAAANELANALRTTHRCVLALLAACALFLAVTSGSTDEPTGSDLPPRPFTLAAVGLALGVIATRRVATSPAIGLRTRVALSIASLALAALLGLVASALGVLHGATQPALMFTLAAALIVLRPPPLSRAPAAPPER